MDPKPFTETEATEIASRAMSTLARAWNASDSAAFAAPFTKDADFVDIRGVLHRSRDSIAEGHRAILDTIYRGSVVEYRVVRARFASPDVVVAQCRGRLDAPSGPLGGVNAATQTIVMVRGEQGVDNWSIAAFHNTLVTGDDGATMASQQGARS